MNTFTMMFLMVVFAVVPNVRANPMLSTPYQSKMDVVNSFSVECKWNGMTSVQLQIHQVIISKFLAFHVVQIEFHNISLSA